MKIFVRKIISFLVIVAILIQICNYGYLKNDPLYTNKFKNIPDKIDVCSIGTSHCFYGFNFIDYENKYSTFNFGLAAQTHSYDYRVLEYYKDHLKNGSIVFLVVAYPVIFWHEESEQSFKSKNLRYYTFLPDDLIKNFDIAEKIKATFFPFTDAKKASELLPKDLSNTWANGINIDKTKEAFYKSSQDVAYEHVFSLRAEDGLYYANSNEVDAIYKSIELCKSCGAIPILITCPFYDEYNNLIDEQAPDFLEYFHGLIEKIQNDTDVEYYDYSHDVRFVNDMNLFADSNHLSREGARKFTNIIMEEIVKDRL